jgi:tRNA (cytidine32/uridine32-2'-O)-methyltransferase
MFDRVSVVLSHTSHPGNIGATARAMKNMGFSNLVLINPHEYPHAQATAMASGAHDVLKSARVVSSLTDALKPFHYIIGASARHRSLPWPLKTPKELCPILVSKLQNPDIQIALLFGTENSGLTNEELHACDLHVNIPANEAYSSLNLSQAVQVIAYELRDHILASPKLDQIPRNKASYEKMDSFYEHIETILKKIEIFNPDQPRQLMGRIRRVFNRAELDDTEINIIRGFLKAVSKRL